MRWIWAQFSGLVIAFYTGGSSKWMAVNSGCQDSAKQMLDSEALQQQVMDSENFSGPKHKLSVQDATGTCQECALEFPWLKPQKTDRRSYNLLPPTPAIDHIVGAATPFALHRRKCKTICHRPCFRGPLTKIRSALEATGLIDDVFRSFWKRLTCIRVVRANLDSNPK